MPPQLLFETLSWCSHMAGNRTDVFEVRTCPAGGAGTTYPLLEGEEIQQSGRYIGTFVAPGSGTFEVKKQYYNTCKRFVLLE